MWDENSLSGWILKVQICKGPLYISDTIVALKRLVFGICEQSCIVVQTANISV